MPKSIEASNEWLSPQRFRYRALYRPITNSTLPWGLEWDYVEAPEYVNRPDLPRSSNRFGVIATKRELSLDERERFGLELVMEG